MNVSVLLILDQTYIFDNAEMKKHSELSAKLSGRRNIRDSDVDGRTVLKSVLFM